MSIFLLAIVFYRQEKWEGMEEEEIIIFIYRFLLITQNKKEKPSWTPVELLKFQLNDSSMKQRQLLSVMDYSEKKSQTWKNQGMWHSSILGIQKHQHLLEVFARYRLPFEKYFLLFSGKSKNRCLSERKKFGRKGLRLDNFREILLEI